MNDLRANENGHGPACSVCSDVARIVALVLVDAHLARDHCQACQAPRHGGGRSTAIKKKKMVVIWTLVLTRTCMGNCSARITPPKRITGTSADTAGRPKPTCWVSWEVVSIASARVTPKIAIKG